MSNPTDDEMKADILARLHRRVCWGGKHTALETVKKGVPKHLGGDYMKLAKELIKDGFISSKPTSYGQQISLNPARMEEIISRIEKFMRK